MKLWDRKHDTYLKELFKYEDTFNIKDVADNLGYPVSTVARHCTRISRELGFRLKGTYSYGRVFVIKSAELEIDITPVPEEEVYRYKCLTENAGWITIRATDEVNAVEITTNRYPGAGKVLKTVSAETFNSSNGGRKSGTLSMAKSMKHKFK